MNLIYEQNRQAAEKVAALLARRNPEQHDDFGIPMRKDGTYHEEDGAFDPWTLFPLYGRYCGDFDQMAIEVLCDLRDRKVERRDLASRMFREMLCTLSLCDYGSSPRGCFPTPEFEALLPELIERWKAYSAVVWDPNED